MSLFNPFQTFKRLINSHLLKGGCVDQRLVSFCWHCLCYQTASNTSFCKINGLGLTQFGCSWTAVKSFCGLLSDTKLTFPWARHLYSGVNAISHKVVLQLHELVFGLSITRASVECTGWAEDEQLKHPLLPAGTGSLCSPALLSELGMCSDKQSWSEQWQKCDCPKLQFAPWESQWNPHQDPWSLQEGSALTEGARIIIKEVCAFSDFAFKWFHVHSS